MQVVASVDPALALRDIPAHAKRVEAMGYDALHISETVHDPFVASLLALEHTSSLVVRTSLALAFPRSPMVVAYAAWDLARFSGGRFELGLGTQIRANIEGRYSVPWRDPVGRMREYLLSLHAIFASFRTGAPLQFEGEHYRFTRLQPYFNPGPHDMSPPPLWLGGVNEKICRLAGELADGFVTHPTNSSPRYLEVLCIPNLMKGAERIGRTVEDIELIAGAPIVVGATTAEISVERERQRGVLAFLYSTPAYGRTLELHGWTELGDRLRELSRAGRWDEMTPLITDDVLDTLVPQTTYEELPAVIDRWYGRLVTGVLVPPPADPGRDEAMAAAIQAMRARPTNRLEMAAERLRH